MMKKINVYDQISKNKRLSIILSFLVILTISALGYAIGYIYHPDLAFFAFILAIAMAILFSIGGYYYSDKIVLSAVNAKKADPVKYKKVYDLLEGLCIGAGMKMPKLYIIDSPDINAFATGRDPEHAAIGVTTGAIEKLNKLELEGVLAHELSHIKNYDIRFMTLVSVLVGTVIILSELLLRSFYWSGTSRERDKSGIEVIFIIAGFLLALIAPLLMKLIQFAISRKREYLADAQGALITRYPDGLADALEKIKKENKGRLKVSKATMHLFISNPLRKFEAESLFSTHPPIDKRIKILRSM